MIIRVFMPAGLPANAPIVMDVHGGGFIHGSLNTDNYRCICLAVGTPAPVVSVDDRLAAPNGVHFPRPLMDCYAALNWLKNMGPNWEETPTALPSTVPAQVGTCVLPLLFMCVITAALTSPWWYSIVLCSA